MGFHFKFTPQDANRMLFILILLEVFLTLTFDLGKEASIPAWFSSMQLFLIGILFLFSKNWPKIHCIAAPYFLLFVGAGFIFLSMDEAAALHEKITAALKHIEWVPRFKGDHGIWIPAYFSMAIAMAVIGRRTIISGFKVYPRQAIIMLSGTIILLTGAVGLEIISYQYLRGSEYSYLYEVEVMVEEFFEMVGASLILYGTILCAHSQHSENLKKEKNGSE